MAHGLDIAPDAPNAERNDYATIILERRLRDALARLNPDLPTDALDRAFRRLTRPEGATTETRNRTFHRMLVAGVTVEGHTESRAICGAQARVVDFDDPGANDWLAVNQFTVAENRHMRRPDIVLFLNGLPLGIIELKHPTDEDSTIWTAWQQIQTYKAEVASRSTGRVDVTEKRVDYARLGIGEYWRFDETGSVTGRTWPGIGWWRVGTNRY